MAKINEKFVESRKSFLELGKQLECEKWYVFSNIHFEILMYFISFYSKKLAFKPHVLGGCEHIFCLSCTNLHSGKPCPICGIISDPGSFSADLQMEKLLKAYLPMAKFLGIDVTKTYENDVDNSKEFRAKSASVTPSVANRTSRIPKNPVKTNNFASPAQIIKKPERTISLNESLNSSISGTPASKLNKRNQKGETQLHVVSDYQHVEVFSKFSLFLMCWNLGLSQAGHSKSQGTFGTWGYYKYPG